jgi:hypothetical protein
MPIYTGRSADGSDMEEWKGIAYVNPENEDEWSTQIYPRTKQHRIYDELMDYMSGKYTLNDVYKQIQNKTCPLPTRLRNYVLSHYDENGKFINDEN